jgi:uncharacterized protein YecE (DUF72 family)
LGGQVLPSQPGQEEGGWSAHYAEFFKTVEINSTLYRQLNEFQDNSWIKKARDLESFEYSVKVPQLVTHRSMIEGDLERTAFWASCFQKTCLKPLAKEGPLYLRPSSALALLQKR